MVGLGKIHLLLPNPHSRTRNLAQELRNWLDSTSIYDTPGANTDQQIIIKILVPKDIYNTFLRINHTLLTVGVNHRLSVPASDNLCLSQTVCVCQLDAWPQFGTSLLEPGPSMQLTSSFTSTHTKY